MLLVDLGEEIFSVHGGEAQEGALSAGFDFGRWVGDEFVPGVEHQRTSTKGMR
jgi:hypothetical protein